MRFHKWLLLGFAASLSIPALTAQEASPEQINRALELLRSYQAGSNAPAMTPKSTNVAPVAPAANAPRESDKQVQQLMQNLQTSPPPSTIISDPRTLRETSQKAESAVRARQPVGLEGQRPASLAEEQAMRARIEAERQKEVSRIEAEVNRIRQRGTNVPVAAPVQVQAAPVEAPDVTLTPEAEKKARELLDQQLRALPTTPAPAPSTTPAPAAKSSVPQMAVQDSPASSIVAPAKPALAPDLESKAREMLNQVMTNTQGARPPVMATPSPAPTAEKSRGPVITVTPPPSQPAAPVAAAPASKLTPEQERKARELLDRALAGQTAQPAVTAMPQPAPVKPATPSATLTPEQERQARELLQKQQASVPAIATPAPAPKPVTPAPQPELPKVVVTPPTPAPQQATPVVPVTPKSTMTPEQEQQARALLEKTMGVASAEPAKPQAPAKVETKQAVPATVPAPKPVAAPVEKPAMVTAPPPVVPAPVAPQATITPDQEQQARELLNKAFAQEAKPDSAAEIKRQEKAQRELERLNAKSLAKAQEEARKRLMEEAKAREAAAKAKPAPATSLPAVVETKAEPKAVKPSVETAAAKPATNPEAKPEPVKIEKTSAKGKPAKEAPAAPASGPQTKQQRLAALLDAYMKDKLTPEQYHMERAKIVVEP